MGKFLSAVTVVVLSATLVAGCAQAELGDAGSLRVQVVGFHGAPLDGAKVVSDIQPEGQLKVTGITSIDGMVTYSQVKSGSYEFYITRPDYQQTKFTVTVAAGGTTDVTMMLTRTPSAQRP